LVLNANLSNISALSWREQIVLDAEKTLRNKRFLSIKQSRYMYK
jgi:hypothetical protein